MDRHTYQGKGGRGWQAKVKVIMYNNLSNSTVILGTIYVHMDVAAGYLVYNVMQVSIPKVGEAQGTEITAYIHLPLFSPMIK